MMVLLIVRPSCVLILLGLLVSDAAAVLFRFVRLGRLVIAIVSVPFHNLRTIDGSTLREREQA